MNKGVLFGIVLIVVTLCAVLYMSVESREAFSQGYDAPFAGCIKQCELSLLRRNPYFVQLQEGGRMTQNYCRQLCANEYNKTDKMCTTL